MTRRGGLGDLGCGRGRRWRSEGDSRHDKFVERTFAKFVIILDVAASQAFSRRCLQWERGTRRLSLLSRRDIGGQWPLDEGGKMTAIAEGDSGHDKFAERTFAEFVPTTTGTATEAFSWWLLQWGTGLP